MTDAKFSILTDGIRYLFYSDLEKVNKMDDRCFFEFNVCKYEKEHVDQLKKFTKALFDINKILETAENLKYGKALANILSTEFKQPSDDFIKLLIHKVYDGKVTTTIKEKFNTLILNALSQFLRNEVNERLELALEKSQQADLLNTELNSPSERCDDDINTTNEEIESYMIIRAIASEITDCLRIAIRDAKVYCAILFDNNNRKPIARLYYKKTKMAIGIFIDGKEQKFDINKPSDLYLYKSQFIQTIQQYLPVENYKGLMSKDLPRDLNM